MRSVAERFVRRTAAAAQACVLRAQDGAPGAGTDFEIALHLQRSIRQRIDAQWSVARVERLGLDRCRLARSLKRPVVVAIVAERLVARLATATKRGADHRC